MHALHADAICRRRGIAILMTILLISVAPLYAQPGPAGPQGFQNANFGFGLGPGNNAGTQGTNNGPGGGANADFDSLIELIQSTVAVDSWAENGGGEAEIRPFPTGVLVDTAGTLLLIKAASTDELTAHLLQGRIGVARQADSAANLRDNPSPGATAGSPSSATLDAAAHDARQSSAMRYVSLPRLEREIIARQDAHQPLDETMLTLAGLQRVQFIFVYPESGDLVLAGPAGDWQIDPVGRIIARDTGRPILRLDDLLTLLRRAHLAPDSFFGCMINPRTEALARTQAFLNKSAARPLERNRRDAWLAKIRETLGRQDVSIFGVDPASRVARVLVEADVHMKLVGMGLEDGVPGVESYLDSVVAAGGQASAISVLRWWFALNYEAVRTSPAGDAYELVGPGVRVLSENEMLAAQGRRVHTGQSDPLNRKFADSFTTHFAALADKHPVYGEMRNLFDLAMAVALIYTDGLHDHANWQPTRLVDAERLRLPRWPVLREVDTVANYREVNRRKLIAGVSGGVMVDARNVLANPRDVTPSGDVVAVRRETPPADAGNWWWDAEQTQ